MLLWASTQCHGAKAAGAERGGDTKAEVDMKQGMYAKRMTKCYGVQAPAPIRTSTSFNQGLSVISLKLETVSLLAEPAWRGQKTRAEVETHERAQWTRNRFIWMR